MLHIIGVSLIKLRLNLSDTLVKRHGYMVDRGFIFSPLNSIPFLMSFNQNCTRLQLKCAQEVLELATPEILPV